MAEDRILQEEQLLGSLLDEDLGVESNISNESQIGSDLDNAADLQSDMDADSQIESELDSELNIESTMNSHEHLGSDLQGLVSVTKSYTGGETREINVIIDDTKDEIKAELKKQWFTSIDYFPAVGSNNMLYADISTGTIYYWNEDTVSYDRIIGDWTEIESINGGNA